MAGDTGHGHLSTGKRKIIPTGKFLTCGILNPFSDMPSYFWN